MGQFSQKSPGTSRESVTGDHLFTVRCSWSGRPFPRPPSLDQLGLPCSSFRCPAVRHFSPPIVCFANSSFPARARLLWSKTECCSPVGARVRCWPEQRSLPSAGFLWWPGFPRLTCIVTGRVTLALGTDPGCPNTQHLSLAVPED